jgi:hypothetical protein
VCRAAKILGQSRAKECLFVCLFVCLLTCPCLHSTSCSDKQAMVGHADGRTMVRSIRSRDPTQSSHSHSCRGPCTRASPSCTLGLALSLSCRGVSHVRSPTRTRPLARVQGMGSCPSRSGSLAGSLLQGHTKHSHSPTRSRVGGGDWDARIHLALALLQGRSCRVTRSTRAGSHEALARSLARTRAAGSRKESHHKRTRSTRIISKGHGSNKAMTATRVNTPLE